MEEVPELIAEHTDQVHDLGQLDRWLLEKFLEDLHWQRTVERTVLRADK